MWPAPSCAGAGWRAELRLAYQRRGARTVLVERAHRGPLVVQRPLYPEGETVCHTILVHPPAGIAGGDRLALVGASGSGKSLTCVGLQGVLPPGVTAHAVRHRFATVVYARSRDIRAVQTLLGHAKLDTTMVYVGVSDASTTTAAATAWSTAA